MKYAFWDINKILSGLYITTLSQGKHKHLAQSIYIQELKNSIYTTTEND
jgi:hypothetical protein